jgi:hypothetical protein
MSSKLAHFHSFLSDWLRIQWLTDAIALIAVDRNHGISEISSAKVSIDVYMCLETDWASNISILKSDA